MEIYELDSLRNKLMLETGEYDRNDILVVCKVIEELIEMIIWQEKVLNMYPDIDLDIETGVYSYRSNVYE